MRAGPEPNPHRKCKTCNNSWIWHQSYRPIHPFNEGDAGATAFLGVKKAKPGEPVRDNGNGAQVTAQTGQWPIDPVLRVALIHKGILTPQDLRDAEEVIRATTAQFHATVQEARNGESAEEARGREVQE